VSALLDWELAHLGHPLDDLGAAVWACLDVLDPAVVVKAYERERDAPVDHQTLRWFECLASVSRSVMLLEGVRAYVEGRTARPAVAGLGLELLAASLERAVAAAGWRAARAPGTRPSGDAQDEERVAPPAPLPGPAGIARGVARFLREEALAAVGDAALRGSLRVAAALLETAALRAEAEPAVQAERVRAARALLEELAEAGVDAGDLEVAAVQVESLDAFAGLRERVRGHLVDDLAVTRALLMPLHDLYGSPPPDRARWGSPQ